MLYLGIDVHYRVSVVCILDEHGRKVKTVTVKGHWRNLLAFLQGLDEPFCVCYEASTGYGWLHDRLTRIAESVQVAHPGQLRLIFRSKRKHDRVDAEKLAKLLFLGEVPQVHVPRRDVRSWRSLIEHRAGLLRDRTGIKNRIRALLRTHAVIAPKGLWTKKGLAWLETLELPSAMEALQRDMLLEKLRLQENMLKRVEAVLKEIADTHPGVMLLMTIPGVGIRTAEAVVAYIDDPKRFKSVKAIGAYFGLVPSEDTSAGKQRLGHITREGPATVRRLLTEAAWQSIRRSADSRTYFERVMQGQADRKKIAVVATAHRLLRAMLAMLRTGEVWREAA
jgi:transposase